MQTVHSWNSPREIASYLWAMRIDSDFDIDAEPEEHLAEPEAFPATGLPIALPALPVQNDLCIPIFSPELCRARLVPAHCVSR